MGGSVEDITYMDDESNNSTNENLSTSAIQQISDVKEAEQTFTQAAQQMYESQQLTGEIKYSADLHGYQRSAKFVRIEDLEAPNYITNLLNGSGKWKLTTPDLVISILGDPDEMSSERQEHLKISLIKATYGKRCWFITDGFNYGIAKYIGDLVTEIQQIYGVNAEGETECFTHCIAIADWKTEESEVVRELELRFNANHSHLLLVDVTTVETIQQVRANCESAIKDSEVPFIRLLIGGEILSVLDVICGLWADLPLIICTNTGGAADTIAECNNQIGSIIADRESVVSNVVLKDGMDIAISTELQHVAKSLKFPPKSYDIVFVRGGVEDLDDTFATIPGNLVEIMDRQYGLLNVFDVTSSESLQREILRSAMIPIVDKHLQLILAQKWDRADLARNYILKYDANCNTEALKPHADQLFLDSLRHNLVGFVKLLLDREFSAHNFLTLARLTDLYSSTVGTYAPLHYLLNQISTLVEDSNYEQIDNVSQEQLYYPVELASVHRLLVKMDVGCSYIGAYSNDKGIDQHQSAIPSTVVQVENETEKDKLLPGSSTVSSPKVNILRSNSQEAITMATSLKSIESNQSSQTANSQVANETIEFPFNQLFIWALLLDRYEMAQLTWEYCKSPLLMALLGSQICKRMAELLPKHFPVAKSSFEDKQRKLEETAIELLDQVYQADIDKSVNLLNRDLPEFSGKSLLQLAALWGCQKFVASQPCQNAINKTWKRGYQAGGKCVFICTFVPHLIQSRIKFTANSFEPKTTGSIPSLHSDTTVDPNKEIRRQNEKETLPAVKFEKRSSLVNLLNVTESARANENSVQSANNSETKKNLWVNLGTFYTSPCVKFIFHTVSYLIFLILYAYVCLFAFRPNLTASEVIVHFWIFTLVIERWRKWGRARCYSWLFWYNLITTVLAVGSVLLRSCVASFSVGRFMFIINFLLFLSGFLEIYLVSRYFGPKVLMMKQMLSHMIAFIAILAIFLLAYTICSLSFLHPQQTVYKGIFWDLFNYGIWDLFGGMQDALIDREISDTCNATESDSIPFECEMQWWPPRVLLAVYLFAGCILMVNLLIAIFAHVFEKVQESAEQIWRFTQYFVVDEYKQKSIVVAPFIIVTQLYSLFCYIKQKFGKSRDTQPAQHHSNLLTQFEEASRSNYLFTLRTANAKQINSK